ncbi:oligosaccharide repeat unit polymerase [bacterium]|nr:oligosaccharide repeat unit polymerase [bacterium]
MITFLGFLALSAAAYLLHGDGRRGLGQPALLFCGTWALLLLLLSLPGSSLFPVSPTTVFFVVAGALSFSAGCRAQESLAKPRNPQQTYLAYHAARHQRQKKVDKILNVLIGVSVIGLPFYLDQQVGGISYLRGGDLLYALRRNSLAEADTALGTIDLISNLSSLAQITALVAALEWKRSRVSTLKLVIAIATAVGYALSVGSAAPVLRIFSAVGGVMLLSTRSIDLRISAALGAITVAIFVFLALQLGKGYIDPELSAWDNLQALRDTLITYSVGSVVALDRIVHAPDAIPASWHPLRVPMLALVKLGIPISVPPLHAEFTQISNFGAANTYTMYFAYLPWLGFSGTLLANFSLGFGAGWTYTRARLGQPVAGALYGLIVAGIVFSGFNENLLLGMDLFLKTGVLVILIYGFKRTSESTRPKSRAGHPRRPRNPPTRRFTPSVSRGHALPRRVAN